MTGRPGVLVIDDEADMRALISRILGRHYEVVSVANAAQARDRLALGGVQVALCDIKMADGDGLDLLREIVAQSNDVAVVMVTGVDDPAVAEEALALGAYGYLLKPFTPSQMTIMVARRCAGAPPNTPVTRPKRPAWTRRGNVTRMRPCSGR